jgi:hypothetical protein
MKSLIAALSLGLLLILAVGPARAATVSGLYEAQVPAAGEDTASRNQAIGEALRHVLVKVTGRAPAPGAAELLPQAARYVQEYRYHRDQSADGETQTNLWVRFDKTGLDRVLRDRGLPLWGNSRPGVLVWLAMERAGRRELAGNQTPEAAAVLSYGADRGLPVQLPLMDLEDQGQLTPADLWSDYAPAVRQASARYHQPLILSGRLRQVAPDLWSTRWTLYEEEGAETFEVKAEDASGAIRSAIGQVAELLSGRYAPAGGHDGEATVRLKITGVDSLQDYARALKLVGEREVVEQVAVRSVEGDSLLLAVRARGGRDALSQVLDLVRGLSREPDLVPPVAPVGPLPDSIPDTPAPAVAKVPDAAPGQPVPQPGIQPVQPSPQPVVQPAAVPAPVLIYRLN